MNPCRSLLSVCVSILLLLAWAPPVVAVGRDGMLDPSFGTQGKVLHAFPGSLYLSLNGSVEVAVLPSGQVLVSSTVINSNGNNDFGVIRLNAGGSLDTSFGVSGGRLVGFDRAGSSLNDTASGMVVQPNGRIVISGWAAGDATTGSDIALVRLTAAGNLDNTFGTVGRVLVPFNLGGVGHRDEQARGLALQPDGKILIAGVAASSTGLRLIVARLNVNGQRDTTFDGDGRVDLDFLPDYTGVHGLQVRALADGGVLVAGAGIRLLSGNTTSSDFVLVKLTALGALDTDFGNGGRVSFDFAQGGDEIDIAYDVIELPDGRLLACGEAMVNAPSNSDMACVVFLADGSRDTSHPIVLVPFDRGGTLGDRAMRILRDAQGRSVLIGQVESGASNHDFGLARMRADGSLDASFWQGGTRTLNSCVPICFLPESNNPAMAGALQSDGRIVVAGVMRDASHNYRFMVARVIGDVLFSDHFDGELGLTGSEDGFDD